MNLIKNNNYTFLISIFKRYNIHHTLFYIKINNNIIQIKINNNNDIYLSIITLKYNIYYIYFKV